MCDMDQLSLNSVWIHSDKTPVTQFCIMEQIPSIIFFKSYYYAGA